MTGLSLSLLLVAGGCSYRLEGLSRGQDDNVTTGSIRQTTLRPEALPQPQAVAQPQALPQQQARLMAADRDLTAARGAVLEALATGDRDTSVPWEDSATGARGTVTPLSKAYSQGGATCRDFLVSHVRDGSEAWLQGEACRDRRGHWQVRQMRPWRRT